MERLIELIVLEDGSVLEEVELICPMTGFRTRWIYHHLGEGLFRSQCLGPS